MISNISKKLLTTALALCLAACNQLDAMKRLREEPNPQGGNSIILGISSEEDVYAFPDHTVDIIHTTLEGFKKNQVDLMSGSPQPKMNNSYAIQWHKNLHYLNDNDTLIIVRYDCHKNEYVEVPLNERIKKRILQYLCYTTSDKSKNCFNFVNETVFNLPRRSQALFTYGQPLSDEASLKPGDPIVLFDECYPQEERHYTLYLGNGLFISKCGFGNPLLVTTLKTMKQNHRCRRFAVLLAIPWSGFHKILPKEVSSYIITLFCMLDRNSPEDIVNLVHFLHNVFKCSNQETIQCIQSHMDKKGPNFLHMQNSEKNTALHLASTKISRLILQAAEKEAYEVASIQNNKGETALHNAVQSYNLKKAILLLYTTGNDAKKLIAQKTTVDKTVSDYADDLENVFSCNPWVDGKNEIFKKLLKYYLEKDDYLEYCNPWGCNIQ